MAWPHTNTVGAHGVVLQTVQPPATAHWHQNRTHYIVLRGHFWQSYLTTHHTARYTNMPYMQPTLKDPAKGTQPNHDMTTMQHCYPIKPPCTMLPAAIGCNRKCPLNSQYMQQLATGWKPCITAPRASPPVQQDASAAAPPTNGARPEKPPATAPPPEAHTAAGTQAAA